MKKLNSVKRVGVAILASFLMMVAMADLAQAKPTGHQSWYRSINNEMMKKPARVSALSEDVEVEKAPTMSQPEEAAPSMSPALEDDSEMDDMDMDDDLEDEDDMDELPED